MNVILECHRPSQIKYLVLLGLSIDIKDNNVHLQCITTAQIFP
jgi:hypothetical protein